MQSRGLVVVPLMKPDQFAYWLMGYFEVVAKADAPQLSVPPGLNHEQCAVIKRHLALVFKHIDEPDPTGDLQATHDGPGKPEKPHFGVTLPNGGPVYRC